MDELKTTTNDDVDQLQGILEKVSVELRVGMQPAVDNFIGFFHAIDWKAIDATTWDAEVKENQEKDKIGSKPDKNGKRGEARKSQKQLQSIEKEKLKKTQVKGPNMQTHTKDWKCKVPKPLSLFDSNTYTVTVHNRKSRQSDKGLIQQSYPIKRIQTLSQFYLILIPQEIQRKNRDLKQYIKKTGNRSSAVVFL
nr:transmembrane protein 18 [Tanacetum cinerariifolium]